MENWKMLRVKYAGGSGAMASQSIHHSIACSEFLGSVGLFCFSFFFLVFSRFLQLCDMSEENSPLSVSGHI